MVSLLSNHVHVQSCSNFETWPWWTHTGSAALSHTLAHENCEHFRYGTAGLIGTKVVWQHTLSNSISTSSDMFSMFHIMLTLGQLDHSWKRTLTSNDNEVNDKPRHLQGAKARPYCKVPHLASTLHFSRGPQQQAHRKMLISTYHVLISPWSISVWKLSWEVGSNLQP